MALSKRVKKTLAVSGALVVALPVGLWAIDRFTPSNVRKALPATAANVQEYYEDDNWHGDFVRCLQAEMPQSEMPRFAAKMGMNKRYDTRRDAKLPVAFGTASAPAWWTPPADLNGAYFKYEPEREAYSVATYHDGRVYFLATAW